MNKAAYYLAYYLFHIITCFHILPHSKKKKVCGHHPLFKINVSDQQQSFLKVAEGYKPIKALLWCSFIVVLYL